MRFQNRFGRGQGSHKDVMMNYNELWGFDNTFIHKPLSSACHAPSTLWGTDRSSWVSGNNWPHWANTGPTHPDSS